MRKYLGWGLAALAVLTLVAATTNPGYFNSLIVAGGLFTVEDDGTVTATLGTSSTVPDAALSANVAHLNAAETITGNWVNTDNPWADNEVSDTITVGSGGNLASPPAIGSTTPNTGAFTTLTASSSATFTGNTTSGGWVQSSAAAPNLMMRETDQSSDAQYWRWTPDAAVLYLRAYNGAGSSYTNALGVSRTNETMTGVTSYVPLTVSAAAPKLDIYETDAGADAKRVRFHNESGVFHMAFWDDAGANSNTFLSAQRSGFTVSSISAAGPFSTTSTHDITAGGDLIYGAHLRDGSATGPSLTEKQTNVVATTYAGSRDSRGVINVTATGGPISAGKICRVTFNAAFTDIPYVVLQASDVNAVATPLYRLGVDAQSTTGFDVWTADGLAEDEDTAITWIAIE